MSSHIQSWKLGRAFSFIVGCSYVLLLNLPLFCAMCSPSARQTGCIDYTRVIMYNKPCGEVTSIVSQDGHPTIFMKVLHYTLFYSSNYVKNYLYSKEVDPNTVHLNDYKFMERTFFICNNLLELKPRITIG